MFRRRSPESRGGVSVNWAGSPYSAPSSLSEQRARRRNTLLTILFSILAVAGRVGTYISTPLWQDALHKTKDANLTTNETLYNNTDISHHIDAYFVVIAQGVWTTLAFGVPLLAMYISCPTMLSEAERNFPKSQFLLTGGCMALSSLFFNFGASGARTAPYLQAILGNCNIPVTFIIRYLILRKRPTIRKIACAGVVVLAVFVSLFPVIFPSLENSEAKADDGGATGIAGVLWPLCFVFSQVPFAISNSVIERNVQEGKDDVKADKLNMCFYLFWYYLVFTITCIALFWIDLIPGFGYSSGIQMFGRIMGFNTVCFFGQRGCGPKVCIPGYINITSNIIGGLAVASLIRYSEGANYTVIILALRTPLSFLFWTLFQEQPFQWNPHIHISTWLSIGAILVMFPAIFIYNTGAPEKLDDKPPDDASADGDSDALFRQPLLSGRPRRVSYAGPSFHQDAPRSNLRPILSESNLLQVGANYGEGRREYERSTRVY